MIKINEVSDEQILDENHIYLSAYDDFPLKSNDYKLEFQNKYLSGVDWNNMCIAGGSISNIVFGLKHIESDFDIFIYGLSTTKQYAEKIKYIINHITSRVDELGDKIEIVQSDYCVKIRVFECKTTDIGTKFTCKTFKFDIVLIVYKDIEQILDGFDIQPGMFAYNGTDFLTNNPGLKSYHTQCFEINYLRLSGAYFIRLMKYVRRGFLLKLPKQLTELKDGDYINKHVIVNIRNKTDNSKYVNGNIRWVSGNHKSPSHFSGRRDYKNHDTGVIKVVTTPAEFATVEFINKYPELINTRNYVYAEFNFRLIPGHGSQFFPIQVPRNELFADLKSEGEVKKITIIENTQQYVIFKTRTIVFPYYNKDIRIFIDDSGVVNYIDRIIYNDYIRAYKVTPGLFKKIEEKYRD